MANAGPGFYMLQTYVTDVYFLQTRVQQIIPVVNTFVYQVYTFHQTVNHLWHSAWAFVISVESSVCSSATA